MEVMSQMLTAIKEKSKKMDSELKRLFNEKEDIRTELDKEINIRNRLYQLGAPPLNDDLELTLYL